MIGFYGDDFTGSVDALLQLRLVGLTGELLVDPHAVGTAQGDVVGIAGTARSLPTEKLAEEVLPALEALRDAGCDVVFYKACSTADSSPAIGSIGRAVELGREVFGERPVPLLFAQPDFGRWTFFGTHFARDGAEVHRLDRHPTMSTHPSTPMGEADLRRYFAAQTHLSVGGIDFRHYDSGAESVASLISNGADLVVLDAVTDEHLTTAGRAVVMLRRPVFAVGSGGLARGIGRALGGTAGPLPEVAPVPAGPVLVVSGSCSSVTWTQTRAAVDAGWVEVPALVPDAPQIAARAYRSGRHVVAYTSDGAADAAVSPADVTARLEAVVLAVSAGAPLGRLVVAGGDTSGTLLRRLGARSLSIVAAPWGNLPLLRVVGGHLDGVEVVLKGGQVGTPDAYLRIAGVIG